MLTSICSVIVFYTLYAITSNPDLNTMPGAASLQTILALGTIIIAIFSAILLFYTNSFLIKRRKKELGLYSILGMEKKHIAKVLFYETMITMLASIILGLFGGVLFGKLIFLILIKFLGFSVNLSFPLNPTGFILTACIFAVIFLMTLFTNLMQIHISNPITLLKDSQKGEKEPKSSWLLTLLGLISLGIGYGIAITVKSPLDALLLFFVAVLFVILGTYCLFTSGSIVFLKLLKKNTRFYYRPKNFISVSGLIYRMKQNAVGLANICILCTMVLVTLSSTVSLYIGQKDHLAFQFPNDIEIYMRAVNPDTSSIDTEIERLSEKYQLSPVNRMEYHRYSYNIFYKDGNYVFDDSGTNITEDTIIFYLIPVEDFNRIQNQQYTLNSNEVLLIDSQNTNHNGSVQLGNYSLQVKESLDPKNFKLKTQQEIMESVYMIVDSVDTMKMLYLDYLQLDSTDSLPEPIYSICFDLEQKTKDNDAMLNFSNELKDFIFSLENGTRVDSARLMEQQWYSIYGGFLFLGIFLGSLFMMATVLIIYYKQISEGYDDHDRFKIMQKVGMSKQEVQKTIRKQILMVFYLPLGIAVVHMCFAFPVISKLLSIFGLSNIWLFFICTIGTIFIFALLYALVYSLTAKTYYKLVR